MRVESLCYELPEELIARYPAPRRDGSRLLVVRPAGCQHARMTDLPRLLPRGALLVVNDTQVIPARLLGRKLPTGGKVELLLIARQWQGWLDRDAARLPAEIWSALTRSSKPLRDGTEIAVGADLVAQIRPREPACAEAEPGADGRCRSVLLCSPAGRDITELIAGEGRMPLPPYLRRDEEPIDRERYQTVYARHPGAVAAPTAGLHFSRELLAAVDAAGIRRAAVTLHVGPGTFRPIAVDDLNDHPMHREAFAIAEPAARAIDEAKRAGRPVIAVGTTVVRALEAAGGGDGQVRAMSGQTRLLIQPGYRFAVVDGLLTNFHLPRSTLLALVFAFAGEQRVKAAYAEAISRRYRFYSYGDAMYLPPESQLSVR